MIAKKTKISIILTAAVIIAGLSVYLFMGRGEEPEYTTAVVYRGQLVQTVGETGTVKAASEIDLNFLTSGRIGKLLVRIGDKVRAGQVLAELDYSDLSIKKEEAQAALSVARADLAKLLAGAAPEEIAVAQANAVQAEAAYLTSLSELDKIKKTAALNIAQAEKTLSDLESETADDITVYEQAVATAETNLKNAKSTYRQAIDNKKSTSLTVLEDKLSVADIALDTIERVLNDEDAKDILSIQDTSFLDNTVKTRDEANQLLIPANNSLAAAKINTTEDNINRTTADSLAVLNKIFESLSFCFTALENTITTSSFTQTDLDALKSSVSSQLTTVNTALSSVSAADQNLRDALLAYDTNVSAAKEKLSEAQAALDKAILDAKNALSSAKASGEQQITIAESKVNASREAWAVAKAKLAQIKAGARNEDISLFRAKIRQAQASLDAAVNQIENSIIKAPIDGVITAVNYEIGEQTAANTPAVSVLGENNFEVEVDISETDIAKVDVAQPAEITLDAFGPDRKFSGQVYFIEPAETVIQDVVYYKVKIKFNDTVNKNEYKDGLANIKSGMTANAVITTAKRENVLIMPARAIVKKNDAEYARVLSAGAVREARIISGLRGDGGLVEILSGVKEGDEVVTFIKKKK